MKINKPVYDFLGYKLLTVNFKRFKNTKIENFVIKTSNREYSHENNMFSFVLEVLLKYENEDISSFDFLGIFRINDSEWSNLVNDENIIESIFVSAIFPYVRQKIYSITDDSRGGLQLPIIDLKNINLTKGAQFNAN